MVRRRSDGAFAKELTPGRELVALVGGEHAPTLVSAVLDWRVIVPNSLSSELPLSFVRADCIDSVLLGSTLPWNALVLW